MRVNYLLVGFGTQQVMVNFIKSKLMIKNYGTINLYLGNAPKDRKTISIGEYTEYSTITEDVHDHNKVMLELLERLEKHVDKLSDLVEKLNNQ